MSNNKKPTIFQKLLHTINPNGATINQTNNVTHRYNITGNILKTSNKDEFETAKLQKQQNEYLGNLWHKVDHGLLQRAMMYESTRMSSYSDFEAMENFPEISSALDVLAEESTTLNNHGKMINVHSNSPRIKGVIEDLLFNRLDIHTSLPMWVRNVCKLGDNFILLNMNDTQGVIGVKQLPNYEITRSDGGLHGYGIKDKTENVKFRWEHQNLEFNRFQVAHFRLLGDDRRLPYGTSILEKGRRYWRILLMAEDSMLTYRITRGSERKVFKVDVGNMDPKDVGPYLEAYAMMFKRQQVVDPATGQVNLQFNQAGIDQDYVVPVRNAAAPSPIEVLPGAQNLSDIGDVEYFQNKLFTAIRVPKSFIGYADAQGEGKQLALQDIRFAKTINRIQQTMIQELNKIIIIHLSLLGFDDEIGNFSIDMNNPSSQAKMLMIEQMAIKADLMTKLCDDSTGIAIMSRTRALREVFNWSDDEIKRDLLEQRMERAQKGELERTKSVIKHTGAFDKVDKIYGDFSIALNGGGEGNEEDGDGFSSGGGSASGGGLGGSFGGDDIPEVDLEDTEGSEGTETENDDTSDDTGTNDDETMNEAFVTKLLNEKTKEHENQIKKINEIFDSIENVESRPKLIINDEITSMLNELKNRK